MAEYTTVGSGDCLLTFRDAGTLQWTCWSDSLQFLFTLTAFWYILALLDILVNQSAAWCTNTAKIERKRKRLKFNVEMDRRAKKYGKLCAPATFRVLSCEMFDKCTENNRQLIQYTIKRLFSLKMSIHLAYLCSSIIKHGQV